MLPLKTVLLTLSSLYITALIFSFFYSGALKRELPSEFELSDELEVVSDEPEYKFVDPPLAYKILSQLDVYDPKTNPKRKTFQKSYLGFKNDDSYCDKNRAYFVEYPESLFEEMNVVHSWFKGTFVADTISSVGNDLHGALNKKMTKEQKHSFIHDIKPQTSAFFTSFPLFSYFDITKHVSCLYQMSNQIPGQKKLAMKDLVADAANTYIKKFEDRPHCVSYDKYFPQTWLLNDEAQCKDFFKNLNSPEYQRLKKERVIVYMKKIPGSHRGEGVQPLDKVEELKTQEEYKNGTLCGKITESIIMQHYIHNSLLLDGHKFDFRMYLLVASVNPVIAYYHDGLLRVSLAKYDANSNDKKVLLTNLALNKQIYDDVKNGSLYEGKDTEELKNAQQWSYDRLQEYLLDAGVISDPNWLDNYLRPELKKAMIHLVRLSSDTYFPHSSFYGLYGVDFMLDTDLKLWFIEANSGPAFDGYSKPMEKIISKMLTDHLEVVFGLLRSRMKRVVGYVNKLIRDGVAYEGEDGKVVIQDLEGRKEVFKKITMNYFEKEFEIKKDNGFSKIIDVNEGGLNMYQGLIEPDCLLM